MSIILTNIHGFVEQVGRRRKHQNRDGLDTLTASFVGLSALVDNFVPKDGTAHPVYTGMKSVDYNVVDKEATLCEVQIDYIGKLNMNGKAVYISDPKIDTIWSEGEVSYTQSSIVPLTAFGTTVYQAQKRTISQRYTAKGCTIKYLTNQRPREGLFASQAASYLGFTNIVTVQTGVAILAEGTGTTGGSIPSQSPPTQSLVLIALAVDDMLGWYSVTETYASKMFPGAVPSGG